MSQPRTRAYFLGPKYISCLRACLQFLTLATTPGHGGRRTLKCREALPPPHSLSFAVKQDAEVMPPSLPPTWQCERNQAVTVSTRRPRVAGDRLERDEVRARLDLWWQYWSFFQHIRWSFPLNLVPPPSSPEKQSGRLPIFWLLC